MNVAGAAVYAADLVTPKALTQADVVEAVSETVPTSKSKIMSYSQAVYEAGESHLTPSDSITGLVASD